MYLLTSSVIDQEIALWFEDHKQCDQIGQNLKLFGDIIFQSWLVSGEHSCILNWDRKINCFILNHIVSRFFIIINVDCLRRSIQNFYSCELRVYSHSEIRTRVWVPDILNRDSKNSPRGIVLHNYRLHRLPCIKLSRWN